MMDLNSAETDTDSSFLQTISAAILHLSYLQYIAVTASHINLYNLSLLLAQKGLKFIEIFTYVLYNSRIGIFLTEIY